MRFVMLGVLVGCFCLDPIGSVKAASWTSAKFPGEQSRAVQGCVDSPQKRPNAWHRHALGLEIIECGS